MLMPVPGEPESTGRAVIYNNQYTLAREVSIEAAMTNIHELNVQNPPKAMIITTKIARVKLSELGLEIAGDVGSNGFIEVDLNTGEETFRWMSDGHITLDESVVMTPETWEEDDYVHLNSVEKSQKGDFLISARHTNTIYLVSGQDGHIIWRLGGKKSDFDADFTFCGQHDARILSEGPDPTNPTSFVISFLDNGAIYLSDSWTIMESPTSSGLVVQLDLVAMKATLLKRFMRPDGGSTDRRGNMQSLPNGNTFISWSYGGYLTEHSSDGRVLMEARYDSERFDTYRAYKLPWVGRPSYPPTLVAELYGANGSDQSTIFHVSWNGATDIAYWRFYARNSSASTKKEIGTVPKNGFETSFLIQTYVDWVSAEALDSNHQVLGASADSRVILPNSKLSDVSSPAHATNQSSSPGGYVLKPVSGDSDGLKSFTESSDVHTIERGGFLPPFVLGILSSALVFAMIKWRGIFMHYTSSAYSWLTWTGYTIIWQDDKKDFDDDEVSLLSQDELHALDFDERGLLGHTRSI